MMSGQMLHHFRLPSIRRRSAPEEAARSEEATKAVVDSAKELKVKADDVIRAAYELADARVKERREGG